MKNLTRTISVLLLGYSLTAVTTLAAFFSDSVSSYSYYFPGWGYQNGGTDFSNGSVNAPAGAEVNWYLGVSSSGGGWGSAYTSISGAGLSVSTSVGSSQSDGGVYFTPYADSISYSISASSSVGWEGSAYAGADIIVAW